MGSEYISLLEKLKPKLGYFSFLCLYYFHVDELCMVV